MGAWTLAEALARGLAGIAGGGLFNLAGLLGAHEPLAYAVVFTVEGLGLLLTVALLARVVPVRFQTEDALITGMN